jgi:hypothetical protein
MKSVGENVVRIEADALRALADRLAGPMARDFNRALELMLGCRGRVVVTGMGKSGLIARKIAATLSSTGSPALYLHPVEALHGDLGMIVRGDVVLALSASGETEEILHLLATIKRLQVALIAMTCDESAEKAAGEGEFDSRSGQVRSTRAGSTLASAADVALDCSDLPGSLFARTGSYCLDYDHAGTGRCAGGGAFGKARIQGRRFCQPASGGKAGQTAGASGIVDALGRRGSASHSRDEDAGRDL